MNFLDSLAVWLNELSGLNFSIHGWIAVLLALIFSLGLYAALMVLMHRSHRSGHDQEVDDFQDPRRAPREAGQPEDR